MILKTHHMPVFIINMQNLYTMQIAKDVNGDFILYAVLIIATKIYLPLNINNVLFMVFNISICVS